MKRRPKRTRISCSHWRSSGPGGQTIRMRCARRRTSSSAAIRPAWMVLPKPTPSASSSRGRTMSSARSSGTRWYGSIATPARRHRRAGDLFQQPGDVIAAPGVQGAGFVRAHGSVCSDRQRFGRIEHVPFQAGQIAAAARQTHALLRRRDLRPRSHPIPDRGRRP